MRNNMGEIKKTKLRGSCWCWSSELETLGELMLLPCYSALCFRQHSSPRCWHNCGIIQTCSQNVRGGQSCREGGEEAVAAGFSPWVAQLSAGGWLKQICGWFPESRARTPPPGTWAMVENTEQHLGAWKEEKAGGKEKQRFNLPGQLDKKPYTNFVVRGKSGFRTENRVGGDKDETSFLSIS